jgi:antitoxin HicB
MYYHFKVHKEKAGGYWAESLETGLNVRSQGETEEELRRNLGKALDQALAEPEESKWIPSMPDSNLRGRNVIVIPVEPGIAIATLVRVARLKSGLTQRQVATRLGFKNVIQYQRLEKGSANPELSTLAKLRGIFPNFSVDAAIM